MTETSVAIPTDATAASEAAAWLRLQGVDDASYADLREGRVPDRLIRKRSAPGGDPALFVGGALAAVALLPIVAAIVTGSIVWWGMGGAVACAAAVALVAARLRPRGPREGYANAVDEACVDVVVADHVDTDDDGNARTFTRARFTNAGRSHEVTLSFTFAPTLRALAPVRVRVFVVAKHDGEDLCVFVPAR